MSEQASDGDSLTPATMARMLALDSEVEIWQESDRADLLRHQLDAPVIAELRRSGILDESKLSQLQALASGSTPESFGQVLFHPAPPLELLRAIKDLGKSAAGQDGPLPPDIAFVLYYAAILAALLRHDHRISAMDDGSIRQGADWVTRQSWVDEVMLCLYREGLEKLDSSEKARE